MERDRNLLFGVLAVQLRKATPSQIMEAAGAWATDPSKTLPDRLVDTGSLSQEDRKLIDDVVDRAVKDNAGDVSKTLSALGGEQKLRETFRDSLPVWESAAVSTPNAPLQRVTPWADAVPGVEEVPGRYAQITEYGRGGMGRVLLVHDEYLGRDVALKELLLPDLAEDGTQDSPVAARATMPIMARFLQEARIAGQLDHPSIVPVYELGHRSNGTPYYTMRLVRGRTLHQALGECDNLKERLKLLPHFVDLCNAIGYAHSRGILHRDVKPDNVMVGDYGETVVLDWGLAKANDREDIHADGLSQTMKAMNLGDTAGVAQTQYGKAIGTPVYMPPEQAQGNLDQIDERSDVYSLGAVLFEILTGEVPFDGKTVPEVLDQVIHDPIRSIHSLKARAPAELAAICERAMAKRPGKRYQSAGELAEEIERFQSGALVRAYEYKPPERLANFVRRHKTAFGVAAVALLVIFAGSAFYVQDIVSANRSIAAANLGLTEANLDLEAANTQLVDARNRETSQRKVIERRAYTSTVILADKYMEDDAVPQSIDLLLSTPEAHRHWEWGYLYSQAYRRVVFTLFGHRDEVDRVAYSPDGKRILTNSYDRTARVWDARTGDELFVLVGHRRAVRSAHFSPDGTRILTASRDRTARIWDAETGEELAILAGHGESVQDGTFSPNGTRILTVSYDSTARIWDARTGEVMAVLAEHTDRLHSGSFSPDGTRIVTVSSDDTARIWDVDTGEVMSVLAGHTDRVHHASFSPDSKRIVTASYDRTAKVWDVETGEELAILAGHTDQLLCAFFSPDGTRIVTTSPDYTARIWDAQTGEVLAILAGHAERVNRASFSPSGNHVLTASYDNTARIWDAATGDELLVLAGHASLVHSASYSPDGERIVTVSGDKTVKVWNAETGKGPVTTLEHGRLLRSAAFSPDGKRIAATSGEGAVRVWDVETREERLTLDGHSKAVLDASFSSDGRHIVTASDDYSAKVWDAASGEELAILLGHRKAVHSATFSLNGKRIVTASKDKTAKIWDAETGEEQLSLGHSLSVRRAYFSPDGQRIVTASWDEKARIWDAETGEELLALAGHTERLLSASFSPDSQRVLSVSDDHTAKVWDVRTGKELFTLTGHREPVYNGSFSPDGKRIVTASSDNTAKIWDAEDGAELLTLRGHSGRVLCAAFDTGGAKLLTASANSAEIGIWKALPWWTEAWDDEEYRSDLTKVARRTTPLLENHVFGLERETIQRRLGDLATLLQDERNDGKPPAVRFIEGQGILFNDSWEAVNEPGPAFDEDTLLVRINDVFLPSLADAQGLLGGLMQSLDSGSSHYHRLTLELVNRYSHRVLVLRFPIMRDAVGQFPRDIVLTMGDMAVTFLENSRELSRATNRRLAQANGTLLPGHDFNGVWIGDTSNKLIQGMVENLMNHTGLQVGDQIMSVDGTPIYDMDTFIRLFRETIESIKKNEFHTIESVVNRGQSEIIRLKVHVGTLK